MTLYSLLVDKNKEYIDKANKLYGFQLPYPKIKCDIVGNSAGWAKSHSWEVNYNPHLLKQETNHFLKHVVGHEIAHLIASKLGGRQHDKTWASVMIRFGLPPERCHKYDLTAIPGKPGYMYVCGCMKHKVSTRMHLSIQAGKWRKCLICKQRLTYSPSAHKKLTHEPTYEIKTNSGEIVAASAAEVLIQASKPTSQTLPKRYQKIADIVNHHINKTDDQLIGIIKSILGVSIATAKIYLNNYKRSLNASTSP